MSVEKDGIEVTFEGQKRTRVNRLKYDARYSLRLAVRRMAEKNGAEKEEGVKVTGPWASSSEVDIRQLRTERWT